MQKTGTMMDNRDTSRFGGADRWHRIDGLRTYEIPEIHFSIDTSSGKGKKIHTQIDVYVSGEYESRHGGRIRSRQRFRIDVIYDAKSVGETVTRLETEITEKFLQEYPEFADNISISEDLGQELESKALIDEQEVAGVRRAVRKTKPTKRRKVRAPTRKQVSRLRKSIMSKTGTVAKRETWKDGKTRIIYRYKTGGFAPKTSLKNVKENYHDYKKHT